MHTLYFFTFRLYNFICNKCSIRNLEMEWQTDQPTDLLTDQPINQRTDMRLDREATLPVITNSYEKGLKFELEFELLDSVAAAAQ